MPDTLSILERIAARASTLYSRPTVALEIIKLTEQPHADPRAIKECLERDPALTCRILRVVNSSSYGLRVQVGDLNQAIALLGVKSLKLLVLGFSLPDELFSGVATNELQWYWTNALTRAVAARMLSEQLWRQPGDEAFTAALMQDIGILVLLRELREPYAKFLEGVICERRSLATLENETLGFDHAQLSALLLARWRLPARLVAAVAAPKKIAILAQLVSPAADIPQILCLAELLVELVGQKRLQVLPDLLEAGESFHALTKSKLTDLVEQLQPNVDQLANALSLELTGDRDYTQVLRSAHEQMAALSEEFVGTPRERQSNLPLLNQARELTDAMQAFLSDSHTSESQSGSCSHRRSGDFSPLGVPRQNRAIAQLAPQHSAPTLLRRLAASADRCRCCRQELSLLLIEPNSYVMQVGASAVDVARGIRLALESAVASLDDSSIELVPIGDYRTAAILSNCERRAAVSLAHHAIASLKSLASLSERSADNLDATLSAGIATVAGVPKNFDAGKLLDSAERCLAAARTCGISTVKSIEV